MSFRRSKEAVSEGRAWQNFRQANAELLRSSGLPLSLYESRDLFDDFLMHGYIDHHEDATHFFIGQLSETQKALLVEVIVRYLRAGFPDPGITCFMDAVRDEILRRAGFDP
jgi:hypothetical protein